MKKVFKTGARAALAALVLVCSTPSHARITGTQPSSADIWCVGPSAAEVCVDASGNVVPTTTATQASGTSSLAWSDVRTGTLTGTGNMTLSGTSAVLALTGTSSQLTVSCAVPLANSRLQVGSNLSAFIVKTNGLVETKNTAPAVSSCGSNPGTATGNDVAGDVQLGSNAVTTCTITFANSWTNTPHCFASNRTSKIPVIAQATATTVVVVGDAAGAAMGNQNDVIDWMCLGHQ